MKDLEAAHQGAAKETDTVESLRRERDAWIETARLHHGNEEFYRNIVCGIGALFGKASRTADDGSVMDDVLALKVPELCRETFLVCVATATHFENTDSPLGERARNAVYLESMAGAQYTGRLDAPSNPNPPSTEDR